MDRDDWHRKTLSKEMVDEIKESTKEKSQRLDFNNYDKDHATRWIGTACEVAFQSWLSEQDIVHDWQLNDGIDEWDFTVGKLRIDVKATSTNYEPKMDYGCDVVSRQWDKIKRTKHINSLVFCRFVLPTNTAIVMGWLPVDEFDSESVFQVAGTKLGVITITVDQYEVQVKDLRKLSEIRQFRYY